MASGTQGYQKTTTDKSLADTLISEYKKLRKRAKAGGSDEPLDPANLKFVQDSVQAVDDFIISGINGINSMFSTGTSPIDDYEPVDLDDGTAIDVEIVNENKKQTALLEQQNTLLGSFIDLKTDILADSKRLRQEERMEKEEFLSGTQGYRGAKDKKGGGGGDGILSKIGDLVTIGTTAVAAFKGLPLALKASVAAGLKGMIPKMAGLFKGLKLGKAVQGTKNFFGNMFRRKPNVNINPKNALIDNDTGRIIKDTMNKNNLTKIKDKVNVNKNNLLNKSNLQKVVTEETGEKVLEKVVVNQGDDALKSVVTGSGDDVLKSVVTGSGDDVASSVIKGSGDDIAKGVLTQTVKKPGLLKNFGTSALKSLKNPKNYSSLLISMTTGIISDQVRQGLDQRQVNKNLEGFEDKSVIDKEIEIANMLQDLKKLQEQGKGFKPGEWFAKIDAILGNITTLGIADRGNTDREQKILILKKMLEKLREMGYGELIDQEQKKVDEGHYKTFDSQEDIDAYLKSLESKDENGDQSNAFGVDQFMSNEVAQVASAGDLTGLLGDTNNISKVNGQNFFQTSNSTTTGQLKGLTEDDYNWLAYAISGEAAQGTDDIYGVAASILNRKARGDNDGSIESIIKAPGQFKAFEDGKMVDSPEIAALLKSEEGQRKLMEALRVLKGRTDFKGQSALGNRVASEDPMFDEKGNFYHYGWQTSGDSVKPEGWKPVNWQQYMPGEGIEGAQGLNGKLSQKVAGLSNDTSNAPTFIFIPPTTASSNNAAGSNDKSTSMSMAQIQTSNPNTEAWKQTVLQRMVA